MTNLDGSSPAQTLLIVDDEAINLQLLCAQFQDVYRVLIAKSGQQALQRLDSENIDLILLDICMADMDGYQVLKAIKENPSSQDIPVIFITAKTQCNEEMMGLQLGAVDYIGKPLQLPIVEARVRTHMALRRKSQLLEQLASVDSLTEIHNRRYFDTSLEKEFKRRQRSSEPLGLLMIDVDFFKRFNDNLGHASGDYCLQQVAIYLKAACQRPGDVLCRYGGEEFVIIAPHTEQKGLTELAQRCLDKVESAHIVHPDTPLGDYVTVSIGGACLERANDNSQTPASLLKLADQGLYSVKEASRNGYKIMSATDS